MRALVRYADGGARRRAPRACPARARSECALEARKCAAVARRALAARRGRVSLRLRLAPPPLQLPEPNIHRSNAQELVGARPVIEVAANVAMCDGGGGAMGHPIEFIKLELRDGARGVACRYCGLRYRKAAGHHAH